MAALTVSAAASAAGPTAVAIEDDAAVRDILIEVFESAGFTAIGAENGVDGVEAVRVHNPRITTIDINMPGIDGFETVKRVRAISETYVVLVTKFSGGSGVIPENILSPSVVYRAAILFLIIGVTIGAYFVILRGPFIAVLLAFAVLSILLYSSKIVNFGLAELFVGIKGALIVIGSYYIQTSNFDFPVLFIGAIIGLLSASVLLINSFPDYKADRLGGRRTLVIMFGKRTSCRIFSAMVVTVYSMIMIGISINILNVFSIVCFASAPFALRAVRELGKNYEESDALVPAMASTINYSRITSLALLFSMTVPMF